MAGGDSRVHDVAVVGGGLAGLQAARCLAAEAPSLSVVLLEAAPSLGGRLRALHGLAPWPVEAGAEFLHGSLHSSIERVATAMGCHQRELPYPDHYFFGDSGQLLSGEDAEKRSELGQIHKLFADLANEDMSGTDVSVAEHLRNKGLSPSQLQFAEAIYANDFGCSLKDLGLHECIHESQHWIYGDTYLILDRPLSSVISWLSQGLKIRCNWPVASIQYSEHDYLVRIKNQRGELVTAKKVVIALPLTVLKEGDITFVPPLPKEKIAAINAIGMSNAVKVVLSFSHRFWPDHLFDIVCAGCFLPEIWMTRYPPAAIKAADEPLGNCVAIGFAAGEFALRISSLSEDEAFQQALSQLDTIFGTTYETSSTVEQQKEALNSDNLRTGFIVTRRDYRGLSIPSSSTRDRLKLLDPLKFPASSSFMGGCIVDWSKEPFIRGAYTHPTVGAHGAREELAKPVGQHLFFAGEASHSGVNPCMQAAMDTGERAAMEVIAACTHSRL